MAKKSVSHQRRRVAYLNQHLDVMFNCYCTANEVGDSEAINDILRHFFNNISPSQMNVWIAKAKLSKEK